MSSVTDPAALTRWMQLHLAVLTGQPSETLSVDEPFGTFDLDSLDAVTMALEMEKALGVEVAPETFLDSEATIATITDRVAA